MLAVAASQDSELVDNSVVVAFGTGEGKCVSKRIVMRRLLEWDM